MALYNGLGVSIAGIFPFRAVYFMTNSALKNKKLPNFVVTQIAALSAAFVSFPFDSIRRAQQYTGKTFMEAVAAIMADGGYAGFFDGFGLNMVKTITAALTMELMG